MQMMVLEGAWLQCIDACCFTFTAGIHHQFVCVSVVAYMLRLGMYADIFSETRACLVCFELDLVVIFECMWNLGGFQSLHNHVSSSVQHISIRICLINFLMLPLCAA